MIDFDDAGKLAVAASTLGGGILAYLGRKSKTADDELSAEKDTSLTFLQAQLVKAVEEKTEANKEREELRVSLYDNLNALMELVRRLCYMLAVSDSSRAEHNKQELLTCIKWRNFDMKSTLMPELLEIFGLAEDDILPPADGLLPLASDGGMTHEKEH